MSAYSILFSTPGPSGRRCGKVGISLESDSFVAFEREGGKKDGEARMEKKRRQSSNKGGGDRP